MVEGTVGGGAELQPPGGVSSHRGIGDSCSKPSDSFTLEPIIRKKKKKKVVRRRQHEAAQKQQAAAGGKVKKACWF